MKFLKKFPGITTLYADIPGFISPSVITGNSLRPDLILHVQKRNLYIVELTVDFGI